MSDSLHFVCVSFFMHGGLPPAPYWAKSLFASSMHLSDNEVDPLSPPPVAAGGWAAGPASPEPRVSGGVLSSFESASSSAGSCWPLPRVGASLLAASAAARFASFSRLRRPDAVSFPNAAPLCAASATFTAEIIRPF